MACFGGHLQVVKYLASRGANVHATNEWGCDASHFVGMTISKSYKEVRQLCNFLKHQLGINFTRSQDQGHTILHKAAQKRNQHVIEWLSDDNYRESIEKEKQGAGLTMKEKKEISAPDLGGYTPSQIWEKFSGDAEFAKWMRKSFGW
jgi:ankyrin repeat protein